MAKYSVNNTLAGTPQAVAAAYKTLAVAASSATARRGKLYDITIGTNGTPADNFYELDISRQTVVGTGTAATPLPLDPADAAALSLGTVNLTIEPTYAAASSLLNMPGNQRVTLRWVAVPGSELLWPATVALGLGARIKSAAYTGTATCTALFEEQ